MRSFLKRLPWLRLPWHGPAQPLDDHSYQQSREGMWEEKYLRAPKDKKNLESMNAFSLFFFFFLIDGEQKQMAMMMREVKMAGKRQKR